MSKKWVPLVLKFGLSAGLIWWLMRDVDLGGAWRQAKAIDPLMLVAAFVAMLAQIGLGAVRWGMVLRALSTPFPPMRTAAVYYIGVFFSIVLPGAVGGDAVRMWMARKHGMTLGAAVNSVMLERVLTVFALVLLVAATQPLLLARVPDLPGAWVFPLLTAAAVAGIGVLCILDQLPDSLSHLRLVRGLAALAGDSRRLFLRGRNGVPTLAVALLGHANLSLVAYLLAAGLGIDADMIDCLVLVPPVILAVTLPISIAGWGVRETAMVTAFGFIGVSDESALVLSVLFGLLTMVAALPGGLVFLLSGQRPAPEELEADATGDDAR